MAQPAVRPHLIVFLPIVAHDYACFRERPQLFPIQAFIPEPPMKAFHKPVLPRTTWLNVDRFNSIGLQPLLHDLGNELQTVVDLAGAS